MMILVAVACVVGMISVVVGSVLIVSYVSSERTRLLTHEMRKPGKE